MRSGELGRPGHITYLTTEGGLTPLQAQLELALPQKNTGSALLRVSTEGLDPAKFMMQRRVTGNVLSRPGGGMEILYDGPIDVIAGRVKRIR